MFLAFYDVQQSERRARKQGLQIGDGLEFTVQGNPGKSVKIQIFPSRDGALARGHRTCQAQRSNELEIPGTGAPPIALGKTKVLRALAKMHVHFRQSLRNLLSRLRFRKPRQGEMRFRMPTQSYEGIIGEFTQALPVEHETGAVFREVK